jgi:hypothetical protein
MNRWQLAVVLALVCAATGFFMWRASQRFNASRLMQSLPIDGAVKVYIDVDALRAAGLLDTIAGPKTAEDPEYRRFAEEIGFDYRTDLSAVAAVFAHGDFYAAARGRFDWKGLDDYARAQKGQCDGGMCFIPASQPDRYISFYPLTSGVLAMAVSGQPKGVKMVSAPEGWGGSVAAGGIAVPASAFWISAPGTDFKDLKNLPPGTLSFASPLAQAREVAFRVGPAQGAAGAPTGSGSSGTSFEIRMDVACVSPDSAAALARVFTSTTDVLRRLVVKQGAAPRRDDLTAVLVSGRFEVHESNVIGFWPMDRNLIASLVSDRVR